MLVIFDVFEDGTVWMQTPLMGGRLFMGWAYHGRA